MLKSIAVFGFFCAALPVAAFQQAAPSLDDLNTSYKALKDAEEKQDNAAITQHAGECFNLAGKIATAKQPAGESDPEVWKTNQAYAKEVLKYSEYAMDVAILREQDTDKKVQMFELLEKQRPDSEYLPQLFPVMLPIYGKMKPDKSFPFAQRAIGKAPKDEDLLLVLANGYYTRKQFDSSAQTGQRLIAAMQSHGKPEKMSAGDWESRKAMMLGRGYWLTGMSYAAQQKHPQAAESLKASLPFIKSEPELLAAAYFNIGLSSYNLARITRERPVMQEALKYTELCAGMKSGFQANAQQNAYAIKQELSRMR